ncbi:Triosephosphate isomerase [hydrothermal vent metagenome]|uniref:triose-phosphate isomerase n=1 Tax=hydrothermal vent metagenome TaxID=652676 RepID=A0A3B0UFI0_9ZZZZ
MSNKIKPLIAGNWKMNGFNADLDQIEAIVAGLAARGRASCDVLICPPATLIAAASALCANSSLMIGGQDCHVMDKGAHTGDISALMLADAGARYVIIGHSERRHEHSENDGLVRAKSASALKAGLIPIICVGETRAERLGALAITVVEQQLDGSVPDLEPDQQIVVAYEPVWAIGSGQIPTSEDILLMHSSIREWLKNRFGERGSQVNILYGGSMKAGNAQQILALDNVNGGLIGGASLRARDFLGIIDGA